MEGATQRQPREGKRSRVGGGQARVCMCACVRARAYDGIRLRATPRRAFTHQASVERRAIEEGAPVCEFASWRGVAVWAWRV